MIIAKIKAAFAVLGIILIALIATAFAAFRKGRQQQQDTDSARAAQSQAQAAQNALDTYKGADAAAAKVRSDAAKRPPPDPVKRDDLDNTF